MLLNHFKIAFRNLRRNKVHAGVNIFGLGLGIAAAFVLALFVRQELSYDRGFENSDRIYRVATDFFNMGGFAKSQRQLLDFLPDAAPEIELSTRFDRGFSATQVTIVDVAYEETRYFYADSAFFQMFSYRFLAGDPERVLRAPDEAVLTDRLAHKYFGESPALGQIIRVGKERKPYRITGIVASPDYKTHLQADFWLSIEPENGESNRGWTNVEYYNYVRLQSGSVQEAIERGLESLLRNQAYAGSQSTEPFESWVQTPQAPQFWVQPLTDIHLHSDFNFEISTSGNPVQVYVLGLIGVLILLIAGVNYINLSTANASIRAREIGVKQTLGAERSMLIQQFLIESTVYSLAAMFLAAGLSEVLLKLFTYITGVALVESLFARGWQLAALAGFSVAVGVLAGLYPAFFLSGSRPVRLLKGAGSPGGNQRLRSGLVVVQFSIAIALIICSMVVYRQLDYMQTTDKGFEHEGVLVIENTELLGNQAGAFRNQLNQSPQVVSTSFARRIPTGSGISMYYYETPESEEPVTIQTFRGDEFYIPTLGFRLIEGRNFSGDLASDSNAVILNESAVRLLGLGDDPIGKEINPGQYVIGVIHDFNFQSLKHRIEPAVLQYTGEGLKLAVKVNGGALSGLMDYLRETWNQFAPGDAMRYAFIDDNFEGMVAQERTLSKAVALFTALALIIACLGLFGLTTFAVQRRIKEIGIRKTMGATVPGLVGLLSKDFLRLVLVAFVVAAPIAYFTMNRWLEGFAYHVTPGVAVFLLSAGFAVLTAFLTLSYQAIKAARSNPVEALRYE